MSEPLTSRLRLTHPADIAAAASVMDEAADEIDEAHPENAALWKAQSEYIDLVAKLGAENAALKTRLEIDDAIVERASHAICKVVNATFSGILGNANTLVLARAALEAALNSGE